MSADGEWLPPGPVLWRANRLLLAGRLGWPAGAAETCERLEEVHPQWYVWYGGDGFCATRGGGFHEIELFDADPEALAHAMGDAPPQHRFGPNACWCRRQGAEVVQHGYVMRISTTQVRRFR